jgi:thymidylate synthase ThyX
MRAMADYENFSADERRILATYFTNVDKPVFALVNLPEVVKGALFARYSRSAKSLRRLFLDEFLQDGVVSKSPMAEVGVHRAERLYDKILTDYGDDSVAQLGGVHIACEGVSNILTKLLEWGRLMAYLEQSTRYVPYTDRPGGDWKYHVPEELRGSRFEHQYRSTLDRAFETYAAWLEPVQKHFIAKYPKDPQVSDVAYRASIRSKALDTLRGLLPSATISNLGIYGTPQGYENLILRLRANTLAEARAYADMILHELEAVVPAFMRRVARPDRGGVWSSYLAHSRENITSISHGVLRGIEADSRPEVTITEFDPEGEIKVVAAALYATSQLPEDQLVSIVRSMTPDQRRSILLRYAGIRENRRHKPGRAFERTAYRFDILTDYGAFRDLQRHRLLTLEWQPLSCSHGYLTPETMSEVGAQSEWDAVMNLAAETYRLLDGSEYSEAAQYVVPMAYRIRFYMHLNAREATHMLELRTSPQGHPSYRRVCQHMHTLIRDVAGHTAIAEVMKFVDYSPVELERLESEQANVAKRQSEL